MSVRCTADPELAALLEGSYLWDDGRGPQSPGSAQLPLHPAGARRPRATRSRSRGGASSVELNASQENPLVLLDEGRLISVGNFDALPLAQALDVARLGLAPLLTSASERTVKLLQSPVTGLPEGLAAEAGLAESGLSEFGVPAQALAVEAKLLAQPVSIETGEHEPSRGDRGPHHARAARRAAARADGRARRARSPRSSSSSPRRRSTCAAGRSSAARRRALYARVRELVPATARGEPPPQDLEPVRQLVRGANS